jgi:phage shock protein PspC (stress-responsive transcriptional regulator)
MKNHRDEITYRLTAMERLLNVFIVLMLVVFGATVSIIAWAIMEAVK